MRKRPFFALLILASLLLSSSAYFYGALKTPDGTVYTGMRALNASDFHPALARLEQFRNGKFFLNNLYTSEPHQAMMVRPVYFLLTFPFRGISVSNSAVFHILRTACALILLCILPFLIRRFETDRLVIRIAFLLLLFSSGAGWLLVQRVPLAADLHIPESILFLSLGESPHFSFSLFLLWLGIGSVYVAPENRTALPVYCFSLFILWFEHPFDAVTLCILAMGTLWCVPGRKIKLWLILGTGVASILPFVYYRNLLEQPAFAGLAPAQAAMDSPSFLSILSPYLLLIPFAIPGVIQLRRDAAKRRLLMFLLCWIAVQLTLVFAPFSFQRRLIAGLQFPFALLCAYGLRQLSRPLCTALLILLFPFGNLFVMWQQISEIGKQQMPFYLPVSYREAFDWLRRQPKNGAVLSAYVTGNFIPAYTGLPVYIGHAYATPDFAVKKEQAENFYCRPSRQFLVENHIQYVFFGREERRICAPFPEDLLQKVYEAEEILIYAVND